MTNEQLQTIYANNLKIQATLDMLTKVILGELKVDNFSMTQIALDYAKSNNKILEKLI